jgi:Zn-dependent metalloprotease
MGDLILNVDVELIVVEIIVATGVKVEGTDVKVSVDKVGMVVGTFVGEERGGWEEEKKNWKTIWTKKIIATTKIMARIITTTRLPLSIIMTNTPITVTIRVRIATTCPVIAISFLYDPTTRLL